MTIRSAIAAILAGLSISAHAIADTQRIDIPAGSLLAALETLAKQADVDLVYQDAQLKGLRTSGVTGELSAHDAVVKLLQGTPLEVRTDEASGAILITAHAVRAQATSSATEPDSEEERARARLRLAQSGSPVNVTTPSAVEAEGAAENGRADRPPKRVELEEIMVTGSRIRTLNGEVTPFPVLTLTSEDLEQRGVGRVADLRFAIPQLAPSIGYNDNVQNQGPSRGQQNSTSFDLRGLGGNSTLVLIDGRRLPHTGQSAPPGAGGREDFNIDGLPISAIERIEILPQGAGAIYGSEAMAGVVNIILKKEFSGVEFSATQDGSWEGDAEKTLLSATAGFTEGRFSAYATLSWDQQQPLAASDRWFTATNDTSRFGSYEFDSFPYNPVSDTGALSSAYYPFVPAPEAGELPLPGLDTYAVAIPSGATGGNLTVDDYVAAGAVGTPYDRAPFTDTIDRQRNRSAIFNANFDVTSNLQLYAQGRWSRFENFTTLAPISVNGLLLMPDYQGNPFGEPVYLSKVFYDLPRPTVDSSQTNSGATLGARGALSQTWRYDAWISWARNEVSDVGRNQEFGAALTELLHDGDPTNDPVLTYDSTSAGADPNAPGALAGYLSFYDRSTRTDSYDVSAIIDGPLASIWSGQIKAAVGVESQEEKVDFTQQTDLPFLLTEPFSRRVNSAFTELSIPLISPDQRLRGAHLLSLSASARYVDFSDIGNDVAKSFSGLYQPLRWLSFRLSRSEGFKAPTLYSLRGPRLEYLYEVTVTDNLRDTQNGGAPVIGTFATVIGGQPDLNPERSVSDSYGIVLDLPFVTGLSLSVTRWMLDYKDKVGPPELQTLIDFFPERVQRDPATGLIVGFDQSDINLSKVTARGIDYQLMYQRQFAVGNISLSAGLSQQERQSTRAFPGSEELDTSDPPRRGSLSLFWARGPWTAGAVTNYQSAFPAYLFGSRRPPDFPSYIEFNPRISWDSSRISGQPTTRLGRALADTRLSLTVVNLFNEGPTREDVAQGLVVMDPRLRRYSLAVIKRF